VTCAPVGTGFLYAEIADREHMSLMASTDKQVGDIRKFEELERTRLPN